MPALHRLFRTIEIVPEQAPIRGYAYLRRMVVPLRVLVLLALGNGVSPAQTALLQARGVTPSVTEPRSQRAAPTPLPAQRRDAISCAIRGRVVDATGKPVSGARVEIVRGAVAVTTDGVGAFCLRDVPPSPVQVLVTADHFSPQLSPPVAPTAGAAVVLDITLIPQLTESVEVIGRSDSLVGVASTASEGVEGNDEVRARPLLRSAEVLEAVPGVAMTQHSTGGHAPIILLRGYNLDHGTDFATSLEGMPINLPSHAHAQGYTDLNFLMTELIDRLTFDKGPYRASVGDFGTAGSSTIELKDGVDAPATTVEAGSFGQARVATEASRRVAGGTLLAGLDFSHTDGPSARPDDFRRARGLLRYSHGTRANGYSLSFIGYDASWFGSDGYPVRAAQQGWIPRYGSLDPSDGGSTTRYLGMGQRRWSGPHSLATATVYVQHYGLDLFSNLTFHTFDAVHGDQIHQQSRSGVSSPIRS